MYVIVTGNAPTLGNVHENERRESGSRGAINNQGREKEVTRERKVHEEGWLRAPCRKKTMELQFFILEEESNTKA